MTRRRKRVLLLVFETKLLSLSGMRTRRRLVVASDALTKTALPLSVLKTTVLRSVPERKFLPRTVSVSPMPAWIGVTDVIVGVAVAAPAGPAVARGAANASTGRTRRMLRGGR